MKTSFSVYKKLIVKCCIFQIATHGMKLLNDLDSINIMARKY